MARSCCIGPLPDGLPGLLQALVRDGLLTQQNQRRWASYRLAGDSRPSSTDSPQSPEDSLHSAVSSRPSSSDSPQFPPELLALAEPARRRAKLPASAMRGLISALCNDRWLTSRELGALLQRDADNLQTRFLTGMVRAGLLVLRHPDVPNRPDQAYRAATAAE